MLFLARVISYPLGQRGKNLMNDAHMRDGSVIDALTLTSPRLYENTVPFSPQRHSYDMRSRYNLPHAGPKIVPPERQFTVHPVFSPLFVGI
jgi:hypothetical protein